MARAGELEVTVEPFGEDGTLVRVRGELDMATSSELQSALDGANARARAVVDLTDCAFVDSTAVRVLLTSASRFEAAGGPFSLVAPDPRIRRTLEIAGVEAKIPIHSSLEDAR